MHSSDTTLTARIVALHAKRIEGRQRGGACKFPSRIGVDDRESPLDDPATGDRGEILQVGQPAQHMAAWGINSTAHVRGELIGARATGSSPRSVHLLQRGRCKAGRSLGRTTGWIKRRTLERRGVLILTGVDCKAVDDDGIRIEVRGEPRHLSADTVVLCTGQASHDELSEGLRAMGVLTTVIGGAAGAGGIDAERAIAQGLRAALAL